MPYQQLSVDSSTTVGSNIAVIGCGYVGLTLAACLASVGHNVVCTDISQRRVERLSEGDIPIVEEGLPHLVREMAAIGRLSFGNDNIVAVSSADFVFLCLPTPEGADGHADLSFVRVVAKEIGPHVRSGAVVINKSTVPVGTAHLIESVLGRTDVDVFSNPEFLAEGTAVHDSLQPDRIVIGARSAAVARRVAALYGQVAAGRLIITDVLSAELIKYASNAYLATRLTFVNSMAEMCDAVGADVQAVMAGMGADHRIGSAFLRPGPGWGGSCFPKDTQALVRTAERVGCDLSLVKAAIQANDRHIQRIVDKVETIVDGGLSDRVIAVWGLTFKAGTNDLRDSPAMAIAALLVQAGATVRAYDPTVHEPIDGIEVCESMEAACADADALLVATEWTEFMGVDLDAVGSLMRTRAIVDARNVVEADAAVNAGFQYVGVGLGHIESDTEWVAA
jgi:UDPglucose 6-dehydrogenase